MLGSGIELLLSLVNYAETLVRPAEDERTLRAAVEALTALGIRLVAPTPAIARDAARHRGLNISLADGSRSRPRRPAERASHRSTFACAARLPSSASAWRRRCRDAASSRVRPAGRSCRASAPPALGGRRRSRTRPPTRRPAERPRDATRRACRRPGQLGDAGRCLAGDLVELDDAERREILDERRPSRGRVAARRAAARGCGEPRRRCGAPSAATCRSRAWHRRPRGIGLVDVALEQRARVDVEAHSPRSSASTSSTRWRALQRRAGAQSRRSRPARSSPPRCPRRSRARPGSGPSTAFGGRGPSRGSARRARRARGTPRDAASAHGRRRQPCGLH